VVGFFFWLVSPRTRKKVKMPDDLKDTILENAQGPASASGDSTSISQHSLKDQIEADKYLANKSAMGTNKKLGIKFFRLKAGGSI
jgi:hypothetical protein